ncbi:hypothetical protein CP8484711_2000A, partial [Chlamydia psittaci 84-8471/1]|jgi:hypothetical protein
MFAT